MASFINVLTIISYTKLQMQGNIYYVELGEHLLVYSITDCNF